MYIKGLPNIMQLNELEILSKNSGLVANSGRPGLQRKLY